jgi:N-acetylglutamate synthase
MLWPVRLAERIDVMADAAFPPACRTELDGWTLRADPGTHRRTRSVWPRLAGGALGERIARVEDWYARRGLPARFQLTPASQPPGLEEALAGRGYALEAPSAVWLGDLEALARDATAAIAERADARWLALSGADAAVVGRVQVPCAYARSETAAARGALDGAWLGIYEVATLPEARRRGAATAIIGALAAWALARGARRAYLQVEEDNTAAHALYARLGISRAYRYCYRVLER